MMTIAGDMALPTTTATKFAVGMPNTTGIFRPDWLRKTVYPQAWKGSSSFVEHSRLDCNVTSTRFRSTWNAGCRHRLLIVNESPLALILF